VIKPRLRSRVASRPVSPEPPCGKPAEPVRLVDNLLRPPSTSPAPLSAGTPLDEDELAGHQPHWHWPSPSMPPSSIGPDAAHVLAIHAPPPSVSVTAGVKRTWAALEACDPVPTGAHAAGADTAVIQSTPRKERKLAKNQAPGAPDVRSGGLELLASIDSNVLAHLHGLFMAI
jgi:hypothetical protein